MNYKLGLIHSVPPRNALRLSNYLDYGALPPVLPTCTWMGKINNWPMYLNNQLGDCVVAGYGHLLQNWAAWSKDKELIYPDDTILKIYEEITGYIPGEESTDNGMTLEDMLNYAAKKTNLWNDVLITDSIIDHNDSIEIRQAIRIFGGGFVGLSLPATAQNQIKENGTWTLKRKTKNGRRGTWGGHCVPILGYDENLIYFPTWGMEMSMTWQFFNYYCMSAYAIYDNNWMNSQGQSVSGFNAQQMLNDAQLI